MCKNTITIERAWDTRTLAYVVRELSLLLKVLGYNPVLDFQGSPLVGGEGIVVEIKLDKDMEGKVYEALKRLLESTASTTSTCQ